MEHNVRMRITAITPGEGDIPRHIDFPLAHPEHCLSTAYGYRKAGYRFILLHLEGITWEYYRRPNVQA